MDGVIIDSEYHWNNDEEGFLEKIIPGWTQDEQQKIIGLNIIDTYKVLRDQYSLSMEQDIFLEEVNKIATRIYEEKTELMPNFPELIKALEGRLPLALASSSLREWINIVLDRFELGKAFDITVSAQEIEGDGKPAPDIYLHTAKELEVDPNDCVAIEDSRNGVAAAKAARMLTIGFRNGFNEAQNLSQADHIINGFKEFDIQKFLG